MVVKLTSKVRELAAIICRNLWMRRNIFIFENKFENPKTFLFRAFILLEDYQNSNDSVIRGSPSEPTTQAAKKWFPLATNMVKANWDAVINSQQATTSLGGIFRDSNGDILASFYSF